MTARPCADRHPNPKDFPRCPRCLLSLQTAGELEPCRHLGLPTGESAVKLHCAAEPPRRLQVLRCGVHGSCTEHEVGRDKMCCRHCSQRAPAVPLPLRWISTARLAEDAVRLAAMIPPDVDAVAGVPRSGMIPAAIVATTLHLPLWELGAGGLRPIVPAISRLEGAGRAPAKWAVIDDTVYAGGAMRRAREQMAGKPAVFAAVYTRRVASVFLDAYAELVGDVHLLEWNALNSGPFVGDARSPLYGRGVAIDLDGIIVHDAESGGRPGSPFMVPRAFPCRLIATGRAERDRAVTEGQLRALGVRWDRLEMFPADRTPDDPKAIAAFKARQYADSGCGFFLESDPTQAAEIHRLTGKPVVCPIEGKVYQAGSRT